LIIASGLSIQDPRERPLDKKDAASAAHSRFNHPDSDFLTLLNIWNGVHEQWERLATQNQRRKFCRESFLSYQRMREWQDLHAQLEDALNDLGNLRLNESNAAHDAVHRSILAGLLGHVAVRTERNAYKGIGNRQLTLFPGSSLYDRAERPRKGHKQQETPEPGRKLVKSTQPEWVVAGEVVETSQLFARTVAGIDPLWISELGAHLCRVAHENPRWDPNAGQVLVTERTFFYGLEVRNRSVAYGNINPAEATKVFVRSALVEEHLFPALPDLEGGLPSGRVRPGGVRSGRVRSPSGPPSSTLGAQKGPLAERTAILHPRPLRVGSARRTTAILHPHRRDRSWKRMPPSKRPA